MTYPQAPAAAGTSTLASRFALDVDTGSGSPTWKTVFGVFNFQPTPAYNVVDNGDFDSDGWGSDLITSRKLTINVSVRDKLYAGTRDTGQAALQAAAEADPPELLHIRWYDRNGGTEAKEGYAYVQWLPQGGDQNAESTTNVVLSVQGKPLAITNPAAES